MPEALPAVTVPSFLKKAYLTNGAKKEKRA